MKRLIWTIWLGSLFTATMPTANALVIEFTDEAEFLDYVSQMSLTAYSEGFESDSWASTRNGTSEPFTANGLTWRARKKLNTVSGYSDWVRSGKYGAYSSRGLPDSITVQATNNDKIIAAGGWFATSSAQIIKAQVEGTTVGLLNVGQHKSHRFFGMIDTAGMSSVTFVSDTGQWGADDFTIAIPEPATLVLLTLSAPVLLVSRHRKKL